MFKKLTHIFLLLTIFLVTTGFTVSLHYCCDSLVSMSVNSDVTPCCPVENGCCDNETKHIQLEEDLTTPISDTIQKNEIEQLLVINVILAAQEFDHIHFSELNSDLSSPGDLQTNLSKIQTFLL